MEVGEVPVVEWVEERAVEAAGWEGLWQPARAVSVSVQPADIVNPM